VTAFPSKFARRYRLEGEPAWNGMARRRWGALADCVSWHGLCLTFLVPPGIFPFDNDEAPKTGRAD
jgi:hypothetical protein